MAVRVLQSSTFGRAQENLPSTQVRAFEQLHKVTVTFPESGEYVVELSMQVEGQEEIIPFLMVAGEPSSPWSVIILCVGALLVFVVVIRAVKIKRERRAAEA